jgi:hypothetical protein
VHLRPIDRVKRDQAMVRRVGRAEARIIVAKLSIRLWEDFGPEGADRVAPTLPRKREREQQTEFAARADSTSHNRSSASTF